MNSFIPDFENEEGDPTFTSFYTFSIFGDQSKTFFGNHLCELTKGLIHYLQLIRTNLPEFASSKLVSIHRKGSVLCAGLLLDLYMKGEYCEFAIYNNKSAKSPMSAVNEKDFGKDLFITVQANDIKYTNSWLRDACSTVINQLPDGKDIVLTAKCALGILVISGVAWMLYKEYGRIVRFTLPELLENGDISYRPTIPDNVTVVHISTITSDLEYLGSIDHDKSVVLIDDTIRQGRSILDCISFLETRNFSFKKIRTLVLYNHEEFSNYQLYVLKGLPIHSVSSTRLLIKSEHEIIKEKSTISKLETEYYTKKRYYYTVAFVHQMIRELSNSANPFSIFQKTAKLVSNHLEHERLFIYSECLKRIAVSLLKRSTSRILKVGFHSDDIKKIIAISTLRSGEIQQAFAFFSFQPFEDWLLGKDLSEEAQFYFDLADDFIKDRKGLTSLLFLAKHFLQEKKERSLTKKDTILLICLFSNVIETSRHFLYSSLVSSKFKDPELLVFYAISNWLCGKYGKCIDTLKYAIQEHDHQGARTLLSIINEGKGFNALQDYMGMRLSGKYSTYYSHDAL